MKAPGKLRVFGWLTANVCGLKMEQSTLKCRLFCWLPFFKIGVVWGSFPLPLHSCSGHAVGALWRLKGWMPPSCGLLEPGGCSVPATIFQNQPLLYAKIGWWAVGAAGVKVRGFCLTSAQQHGSPACRHLQAAFVGPAGLCKNRNFLSLLLEKPFRYLILFFVLSDVYSLHWRGMRLY